MRKIFLFGCVILFVCCAPKKTVVETEGLEEVIVFGEEEISYVSEEPVLPQPAEEEVVAPPIAEDEPVAPPPSEEEIVAPPIIEEEPFVPPPEEEVIAPAPAEEEIALLPAPTEEVVPPPVIEEEPIMPAPIIEETPPVVEEPYMPTAITPTPPPTSPPPATVLGFRIQIFASSTEKNANRVADDARSSFGRNNVYVQHVAPYYKVRVGDFLVREEAELVKQQALQVGYRGAFVVETMISP
jgi:hypothetical protein